MSSRSEPVVVRSRARRDRGLTLIEVMVALALTIVIVGLVAQIFRLTSNISRTSLAQIDAAREVNAALTQLEADLARYERIADPGFPLQVVEGVASVGGTNFVADEISFPTRTGLDDQLVQVHYRLEPSGDFLRLVRGVTTIVVDLGAAGFALQGAEDVQPLVTRASGFDIRVLDPQDAPTPDHSVLRENAGTEANMVTPPTLVMANDVLAGVGAPPPFLDDAGLAVIAIQGGSRPVVVERLAPPNDDDFRIFGAPSGFNANVNLIGFGEPPAYEFSIQAQLPRFATGSVSSTRLIAAR